MSDDLPPRDWPLTPLAAVGPLRFGATPPEVEAVLGPATLRHSTAADDDPSAPVLEHRIADTLAKAGPVLTYVDGRLAAVDLRPEHGALTLAGKPVFGMTADDLVAWLGSRAGPAVPGDGGIDFPEIGLTLPADPDDGPAVSVRGPAEA